MIPANDLRSNVGTWAVPTDLLPRLANEMIHALPAEEFDPNLQGQPIETTYFDTRDFDLRNARRKGERYLTLRLRGYGAGTFALSAKTEREKYRAEVPADQAAALLAGTLPPARTLLPAHLLARLQELANGRPLLPVVLVSFRRYAVEDERDRLTLDVAVTTDEGKRLPAHVLEYKSTARGAQLPLALVLRPIKLSKFLWATER